LERLSSGFRLTTPTRTLTAEKVILTTGGCSYPGCGTTGDGYRWTAALGHTIVPTYPALVPVTTTAEWLRSLQGITVPDVLVRVIPWESPGETGQPGTILAQRRGSFLFTHFGLSGPAVLDVSRAVSSRPRPRKLALVCDFLPAVPEERFQAELREACAADGKRQILGMLGEGLPLRLVAALLEQAQVPQTRRAAELSKDERRRIALAFKRQAIPVTGTLGFEKAEVTGGGVALEEVDSRTMQSRKVADLYLAGELLDLDGPIGGYNFQAAFSTGFRAGGSV
jgi:predicted Rossmann fold flavoprotein